MTSAPGGPGDDPDDDHCHKRRVRGPGSPLQIGLPGRFRLDAGRPSRYARAGTVGASCMTEGGHDYATIEAELAEFGLIARGGFHPAPEDGVPALADGRLAAKAQ